MNDTREMDARQRNPLRPRLCLTVGVAAQAKIGVSDLEAISPRIAEALEVLRHSVEALERLPWFRDVPPQFNVISGLARATDRASTEMAIAKAYNLYAQIPFGLEYYTKRFRDAATRADFERLWALAGRTLELPGQANDEAGADAVAAEAMVAHSTVIIAVWNGATARGRGRVYDLVVRAIEAGVPVIHVPLDCEQPTRLLWSGFTRYSASNRQTAFQSSRPFSARTIGPVMAELLLPPDDIGERNLAQQFFAETEYRYNFRLEYPLLLAATGTEALRIDSWKRGSYRETTRQEWQQFRASGRSYSHQNAELLDLLEAAFSWPDRLGAHYAQDLRSGLVFNFLSSAAAVLAALASLLKPEFKLPWALVEIAILGAILYNIYFGTRAAWQSRWLDYCSIAERLSPMRSLKLLGFANPPLRIQRKGNHPRRWVDWYVSAIWREMGSPEGVIDSAQLRSLRSLMADEELRPRIAEQREEARKISHLENELHRIGNGAFIVTITVCTVFPILYLTITDLAYHWSNFVIFLSAGLPAIGGAIYALRVHGDYAGAAGRSRDTAASLDSIRSDMLAADVPPLLAGTLATAAARVLLVDLDEWQLTYEQRSLAIPS